MTIEQFERADRIRQRIRELKIMQCRIERNLEETKIEGIKIPENSHLVIWDLCKKEILELEKEFAEI